MSLHHPGRPLLCQRGWRWCRTQHDYAHAFLAFESLSRYLPRMSFSVWRVAAGILLRSVRIACASDEPHLHERPCGMAAMVSRTTQVAFSAFFSNTATIWSTVTESWCGCQQS